jgi:hypothetical protein
VTGPVGATVNAMALRRSQAATLSQPALSKLAEAVPHRRWLAMPAAMHRSSHEGEPWNPAASVPPAEALAASTDGQPTLGVQSRGALVPLDADPPGAAADSAEATRILRGMPVATTLAGARVTQPWALRASRDVARPGPCALASPLPVA